MNCDGRDCLAGVCIGIDGCCSIVAGFELVSDDDDDDDDDDTISSL